MLKTTLRKLIPLASSIIPTALIQRSFGSFVPIFMLHRLQHEDLGIEGQSAEVVRQHLEYFRRAGYSAISLEQLGKMLRSGQTPPVKSAVFTIDDGFIDHHDIAGPLFAEFDIPLTYFMITDFIDRKLWPWDDQVSYAISLASPGRYTFTVDEHEMNLVLEANRDRQPVIRDIRERLKGLDNTHLYEHIDSLYACLRIDKPDGIPQQHQPMSWQQAGALVGMGHRIAAHTRSHRILSRLSDHEAGREITESIARVREMVDDASPVFAYPTGRAADFSEREFATLESESILTTVSTIPSPYIYNRNLADDLHKLPRLALPDSQLDFMQYLGWIEFMKQKLRQRPHH